MTDYSKITALYSRLSVGDEDRDGGESNSIQNQRIFLENYARGQHLTNIRHYIDDDESGRFFDRSAYNEEESTASIYTHDPKLKRKLKRLAEKYPDKVYPDKAVHAGAVSYAVPKSCVSVREPFSDERRRAASERAKNAGYTPPARSIYSENE